MSTQKGPAHRERLANPEKLHSPPYDRSTNRFNRINLISQRQIPHFYNFSKV